MKPLLRWTLALGLLSFTNCAARAQNHPSSPCGTGRHASGSVDASLSAGCPFSATVETLRTQTLGDGTRLQTKAKLLVYRDSYGRVAYYAYKPVGLDEPYPDSANFIQIWDTVTGFHYILLPEGSHVATRFSLNPPASSLQRSAPPTPPQPEPKFTFEELGTQDMLGFLVTGERMTRTYPIGAYHNDRPITVVIETWRSPELGLIFLRKGSDPRNADGETRITSLQQSEPDPALFKVPADYTVQDQKPR